MATKSTTNRAPAKKTQTQRKPATNKAKTTSTRKKTPVQESNSFSDYFHAFSKTKAFAPIMTVLGIFVGICFDLLISWNNYDRFFLILGIELIVIATIWIILLLLRLGTDVMSDTN